jgi:hypothetical protein
MNYKQGGKSRVPNNRVNACISLLKTIENSFNVWYAWLYGVSIDWHSDPPLEPLLLLLRAPKDRAVNSGLPLRAEPTRAAAARVLGGRFRIAIKKELELREDIVGFDYAKWHSSSTEISTPKMRSPVFGYKAELGSVQCLHLSLASRLQCLSSWSVYKLPSSRAAKWVYSVFKGVVPLDQHS